MKSVRTALLTCALALGGSFAPNAGAQSPSEPATTPSAARTLRSYLPANTLLLVEVEQGQALIRALRSGGRIERLQRSAVWSSFIDSPDSRQLLQLAQLLEIQTGLAPLDLLEQLFDGDGAFALTVRPGEDPQPLIFVRPHRSRLIRTLLNLGLQLSGAETTRHVYRGIPITKLGEGFFFWLDRTFVYGTKRTTLEGVVARHRAESTTEANFVEARYQSSSLPTRERGPLSLYLDLTVARSLPGAELASLAAPQDEPFVSFLLGGYMGWFGRTDAVSATLSVDASGFSINARTAPVESPKNFAGLFPPHETTDPGGAHLLGSMILRRDLPRWWDDATPTAEAERASPLLSERGRRAMDSFASEFANVLGGADVSEDFFRHFGSELSLRLVPPTPTFSRGPEAEADATPVLPGFVVEIPCRRSPGLEDRVRVAFQTVIAFVNIERMQTRQRAFLLQSKKVSGVDVASAALSPRATGESPTIEDNFSPSLAFVGDRLVIGSSAEATHTVVATLTSPAPTSTSRAAGPEVHDELRLNMPLLASLLEHNKAALRADALLEGKTPAEAERDVAILIELIRLLDAVHVSTQVESGHLRARATFQEAGAPRKEPERKERRRDTF